LRLEKANVLLKIAVFFHMRYVVAGVSTFRGSLSDFLDCPEGGGNKFLQDVSTYTPKQRAALAYTVTGVS
jgi:hypothetical protein